uniref:peptidylprolyl isomerase n=1 Tax=Chromera velia CCMP2878 TaxID=1169474 RepID=A0A0G4GZJ1_9ALVE|eukprot:Cvel_24041.t1-p1 / transcript=Cvel_24041.t1 / gene=Cvel_24041 / organism=Chromera_velia_CCMP2878 / gene_product=Peptidyl-prolyl cis-trans isomerase, chloroplastic, putative / transcript_product=Peptidyl-prolyl cis-trans isomerase, chloroplastic, putative / location=Cvel_scaffold2554:19178-23188(-) / protein_length=468 / sequence_SO=supercontig / SO=protein_coding / is_pseudo=false
MLRLLLLVSAADAFVGVVRRDFGGVRRLRRAESERVGGVTLLLEAGEGGELGDLRDSVLSRQQMIRRSVEAAKAAVASSLLITAVETAGGLQPAEAMLGTVNSRNKRMNAPSSAGTRVNKDPESLLRLGLPIKSREARALAAEIEGVKADLLVRRLSAVLGHLDNIPSLVDKGRAAILQQVRADTKARSGKILDEIKDKAVTMLAVAQEQAPAGSPKDLEDAQKVLTMQSQTSALISELQENMVPSGYKVKTPDDVKGLPKLEGRATVEFTFKKPKGSDEKFELNGVPVDKVTVTMVVDGYNAPITAGNFIDIIKSGYYNNKVVDRADGFVVQTGKPDEGGPQGFVPQGQSEIRTIPLEIFTQADPSPLYHDTSEALGEGAIPPRLPFQAYGALGMARAEYENDSASSQFFWLLFDSDLTPAGKNFMDGRYTCFGYTITNAESLGGVKEGDIIESAKVISGGDKVTTA